MVTCRAVEFTSSTGVGRIEAGTFSYQAKGFVSTGGGDTAYIVDYCRPYTDIRDDFDFNYEEDRWMQALQAIAITIPVIGGVTLIANCCYLAIASSQDRRLFLLLGLLYIICGVLQGIGLKMMDSYICTENPIIQYLEESVPLVGDQFQSKCKFNIGMRMGISATVFWIVAGLLYFVIRVPQETPGEQVMAKDEPGKDDMAKDDVTKEEMHEEEIGKEEMPKEEMPKEEVPSQG